MFSELDKYIYLFSKAFDVNGNHVKLNEEIQLTAYKHLKGLWLLDGVFNCLDLIFGGTRDLDGASRGLQCMSEQVDVILNTGHYADVEDRYRHLYSLICLCEAILCCMRSDLVDALRKCDEGLLKGLELEEDILAEMAELLCEDLGSLEPIQFETFPVQCLPQSLSSSVQIPVVDFPSLETFFKDYLSTGRPVIIRQMVNNWPCFDKWSFEYLDRRCGRRVMPIEIGRKYTDQDFGQVLMPFHEYLSEFVAPNKPDKAGYLAQHRLLDQVKSLRQDVIIPDYCSLVESEEPELLNCFIGPCTSVSPLHSDPRHNLFCQIRGQKFVRLIDPRYSTNVYLFDDFLQANSSQVDVEFPDYEEFPLFKEAVCEDFIMEEGDCLFIPKKYLHYVRALQPSISLSIWFG